MNFSSGPGGLLILGYGAHYPMHRRGERPEGRSASCSVLLVALQPLAAFFHDRSFGYAFAALKSLPAVYAHSAAVFLALLL